MTYRILIHTHEQTKRLATASLCLVHLRRFSRNGSMYLGTVITQNRWERYLFSFNMISLVAYASKNLFLLFDL